MKPVSKAPSDAGRCCFTREQPLMLAFTFVSIPAIISLPTMSTGRVHEDFYSLFSHNHYSDFTNFIKYLKIKLLSITKPAYVHQFLF